MKAHLDCIPCFLRQALQAARFATDDEDKQEEVLRESVKALEGCNWHATPPEIAHRVHFTVMETLGVDDPYLDIKDKSNRMVLDMYPELEETVRGAEDPVEMACRLAIAGNIMDYGAKSDFDLGSTVEEVREIDLRINDISKFKERMEKGDRFALLCDNAGEIVFDRLLLETLTREYGAKSWHVYVKARPIINDATLLEAEQAGIAGMDNVQLDVVSFSRDYDERTDRKYHQRLGEYDLVISKGQGNYEALSGTKGPRFFYMLMAKCPIVARRIGVDMGDVLAIMSQEE